MSTLLILGYGRSGKGALHLGRKFFTRCVVLDEKEIAESQRVPGVEYRVFSPDMTLDFIPDMAVFSPGISPFEPFGAWAEKLPCPQYSELAFALLYNRAKIPVLAITGTNGKTTTTELTAHVLTSLHYNAPAVGNIGNAISQAVADTLDESGNPCAELPDVFVAEISSFQLEKMPDSPAPLFLSAVLLNITSDHINRYADFEDYRQTKFKIFNYISKQGWVQAETHAPDFPKKRLFSTLCDDGKLFFRDGFVAVRQTAHVVPLVKQRLTSLPGRHNAENMMGALALLLDFLPDWESQLPAIRNALASFHLGAHRVDCFATHKLQKFVDDSKGTNPDAVRVAVERFADGCNIRLILGGLDKGMDFSLLKDLAPNIACAYLYGQAAPVILNALSDAMPCVVDVPFADCVAHALREMESADVLLLSPACASMDQFKDYAARGDAFQAQIRAHLKAQS